MKQRIYRTLLTLMPPKRLPLAGRGLAQEDEGTLLSILRRHRCTGGEVRLFGVNRATAAYGYGMGEDTAYRIASISKMLTAACAVKLAEEGLVDLHGPVEDVLPYPVRHPRTPDSPITLNMLLTHTAGIKDGSAYTRALTHPAPAEEVLAGDSWHDHLPGERWHYSNLGAGLAGCVLEGALNRSFEDIMQAHQFKPLGVTASFYPQRIAGPLADARRVLPPTRQPGFDARERKGRSMAGADEPRLQEHYLLAQGNCCMTGGALERAVKGLMVPGFLSTESLTTMRSPVAAFGERSSHLSQGPGLFKLVDDSISPRPLWGHQGNAYGAVHAAFFDPETDRGMAFLSVGASEARRAFLADVVVDLLRFGFSEGTWQRMSL